MAITIRHSEVCIDHISSVQLLSRVQLFATPWVAACQDSPSITNSQSLFKHMFIESVMLSNHLILCHPLLFLPSIFLNNRVFSNESVFTSGGQSTGVSASASLLPMNTQNSSPLGWTGWISLQSKGLSRVFSNTTVQKHQFFTTQLSFLIDHIKAHFRYIIGKHFFSNLCCLFTFIVILFETQMFLI